MCEPGGPTAGSSPAAQALVSTAQMKRAIGRKRRQNEAKILAAAETVFAERGFAAATTSAIARLAGMPKANLHYYFRTKAALYARVLDEILALWIDTAEAIRPEADPKTALSDYIAAKFEFSRRRPQASKVFANEILHGPPRIRRRLNGELKPSPYPKCPPPTARTS